ncbi:MAG: hypothetical protein PHT07_15625 [Paludibacter sp.]|nr:hypothetical protein [Paludibacter sp.]
MTPTQEVEFWKNQAEAAGNLIHALYHEHDKQEIEKLRIEWRKLRALPIPSTHIEQSVRSADEVLIGITHKTIRYLEGNFVTLNQTREAMEEYAQQFRSKPVKVDWGAFNTEFANKFTEMDEGGWIVLKLIPPLNICKWFQDWFKANISPNDKTK